MENVPFKLRVELAHKFAKDFGIYSKEKGYPRYTSKVWTNGNDIFVYIDRNGYAEIGKDGCVNSSNFESPVRDNVNKFVSESKFNGLLKKSA